MYKYHIVQGVSKPQILPKFNFRVSPVVQSTSPVHYYNPMIVDSQFSSLVNAVALLS